jgi:hypothetical protein
MVSFWGLPISSLFCGQFKVLVSLGFKHTATHHTLSGIDESNQTGS